MIELTVLPTTTPATPVTLADYDVILVNTSGGKDSTAMLDVVVEKARSEGVLGRVHLVHADLRRMEWKGVKELVEEHASHYDLPLDVVSRPQGDLVDHVESRGMWPSSTARYCTSDHKRGQIRKVMTRLAKEWKAENADAGRPCRILNCMGLRAQESPARAKKVDFEVDKSASTKTTRTVTNWLPIHNWTEDQVWARIDASGLRVHEAYKLGMPRLSCAFCIFAPKSALLVAAKHNLELLDKLCEIETRIGHTFRVDLSLNDVREEAKTTTVTTVEDWRM